VFMRRILPPRGASMSESDTGTEQSERRQPDRRSNMCPSRCTSTYSVRGTSSARTYIVVHMPGLPATSY
jgi:hypothetical protein